MESTGELMMRAVQLTACLHTLGILVAMGAGFFGAARARKIGAPGLGPMILAFGVALLGATALVFFFVEILLADALGHDWFMVFAFFGMLMDLLGSAAVLAGILLLKKPPLEASEATP